MNMWFAIASGSILTRGFYNRACARNTMKMNIPWLTANQCFMSSTLSNSSNPLLEYRQLPKFEQISHEHMEPAIQYLIEEFEKGFSELETKWDHESNRQTFSGVVDALEVLEAPLSSAWGIIGHLTSVRNSEPLRKVHEKMQPVVVQAMQKVGQSKSLYKALKSIDQTVLQPSQERIVVNSIKNMERSGIGLEKPLQEKFNKLRLEKAELSTKFSNNLLDSQKEYKLVLKDTKDVDGLPKSSLDLYANYAKQEGFEEATSQHGPWVVKLDAPSYVGFMQHAKSSALREKVYKAFVTRASSGDFDNGPLIKRILAIRKDISRMLGFSNYADMSLDTKMAGKPDAVYDLIKFLKENTIGHAKEEVSQLKSFSNKDHFDPWDSAYWSERLKEKTFQFEEEQLREYFALEKVLHGLFSLSERLFGIRVQAADGETQVWHPDVRFFHVFDMKTNKQLASFYLDPYSRPAEKRGGAWMGSCQGRSSVLNRIPVAYLVCNGSPPVDDKPSLMSFREVETLFHEFGHGLQHMLTSVNESDAAGINGIEWDAVELPSQMMENWCYDEKTLYSFAQHYETGESLPRDLFDSLVKSRNFNAGLAMMRQLQFAYMDMLLHSDAYDPEGNESPFDLQKRVAAEYSVIPPLDEDRFLCSFSHIFAGGYSAGYYSYKWAEVMSADAFEAFEEVGLNNDAAVEQVGRRFRNTVLELGGSVHPSDVFRRFRGRDPSPAALLKHSGLSSEPLVSRL